MHFALTFKLQKNIFYPVGRKKLTDGRIFRFGEAVIVTIFNVSIGCLEEYSMSPSLLYPCQWVLPAGKAWTHGRWSQGCSCQAQYHREGGEAGQRGGSSLSPGLCEGKRRSKERQARGISYKWSIDKYLWDDYCFWFTIIVPTVFMILVSGLFVIREAIQKKNLLLFGFFQFRLDPPPVFWNPSRNFFQNLILYELKFLKVFGLWLSPQI